METVTMSPEELFNLIEPQRAGGELTAKTVSRCPNRRCHQIGVYEFRGAEVTVVTDLRLSPGKAEELGLPQVVPGRAWLGRAPAGEVYGCAHGIKWTKE